MTKSERVIAKVERESLEVLQNLVWTTGQVVDAIRKTNGIEKISTSFLRPMDSPETGITAMIVEVQPTSDMNIYKLARTLGEKIEKAERRHVDDYGSYWKSYVQAKYLYWEITSFDTEEDSYSPSGITTDLWKRPLIRIVISPRRRFV